MQQDESRESTPRSIGTPGAREIPDLLVRIQEQIEIVRARLARTGSVPVQVRASIRTQGRGASPFGCIFPLAAGDCDELIWKPPYAEQNYPLTTEHLATTLERIGQWLEAMRAALDVSPEVKDLLRQQPTGGLSGTPPIDPDMPKPGH